MRIITAEEIEKIRQASESMKGTDKYNKYHMCHSSKRTIDGKWGNGENGLIWVGAYLIGQFHTSLRP